MYINSTQIITLCTFKGFFFEIPNCCCPYGPSHNYWAIGNGNEQDFFVKLTHAYLSCTSQIIVELTPETIINRVSAVYRQS